LLLDEPTNDLDASTRSALEAALVSFEGCVIIASHDRWLLDRLATHILAHADGPYRGHSQMARRHTGRVSAILASRA